MTKVHGEGLWLSSLMSVWKYTAGLLIVNLSVFLRQLSALKKSCQCSQAIMRQ